jgi:hypothetical protein
VMVVAMAICWTSVLLGLDAAQHPVDGRNAGQRLLRANFLLPEAVANFPSKNGRMVLLVELQGKAGICNMTKKYGISILESTFSN